MKVTIASSLFVLLFTTITTTTTTTAYTLNRRALLRHVAAVTTVAQAAATTTSQPANAVLSSKYCANGMGEGCDDLAEGNALIRSLQEKSAANRERNEKEARDAYYMKNYPDWFAAAGKTLVRKADGSFLALDDAEIAQLKRDNKLGFEIPRAMGGQVVDYTQKPILVLKE